MAKRSFEDLLQSDKKLQTFTDTVPAGILLLRVEDGEVVYSNRFFQQMFGVDGAHVLGENWGDFFLDGEERQALMVACAVGEDVKNHEVRLKRPDGQIVWGMVSMAEIPIADESLLLFAFIDISRLKAAEEEIRHLAYHDALTGLPSLRLTKDRIDAALARARRDKRKAAVMFIDLDGFKTVNDTLGHEAGDMVLIEAATRIKKCMRESDTVGRIGGDEFIVVAGDITDDDAREMGKRVVAVLSDTIRLPSGDAAIGASVGIARYPDDGGTAEDLMKSADAAMYKVKKDTKGAVAFAS